MQIGVGRIEGSIYGEMILRERQVTARNDVFLNSPEIRVDWRPFAFGVALVLVMILRPQGLVPSRRRAREFEDRRHEAEEAAADA